MAKVGIFQKIRNTNTPISVGADLCVRPSSLERSLFLRADTQVRPYTSYVSTTIPLIKRCNPDLRKDNLYRLINVTISAT